NAEPTVFRSKAVGEPPLLLPFSVFLAIRDAIAAAVPGAQHAPPLRAPATPEAILDALDALSASDASQHADPTEAAAQPDSADIHTPPAAPTSDAAPQGESPDARSAH
ncbi:xanthine dehydrogenase molybdopterin binding subunit, partial [Paraburkholderia sp. JPY454]|nr:xanthine dehydrogenase molybdopterin binding subunit [Paraburkholderia youngii]